MPRVVCEENANVLTSDIEEKKFVCCTPMENHGIGLHLHPNEPFHLRPKSSLHPEWCWQVFGGLLPVLLSCISYLDCDL